jgi:Cof subfamily protein (haloacid dehalogenase superfamily)
MMTVVFCDMDGTLLNDDHKISEYTVEIVTKLRAKGVRFVLASGRPSSTMLPFHKQLNLTEPLICCNGAMVVEGEQVIDFFPLDPKVARKLIHLGLKMNVYNQFYNYGRLSTFEKHRRDLFLATYKTTYETISGFEVQFYDEAVAPLESVSKWMFLGEHDRLCQVKQVIQGELGGVVDVAFSHPHYLEVVAKGVNKGRAATKLLQKWGQKATEAFAFGDEANDKELLSMVDHGYVMKNGIAELKKSIPRITPFSNDEDGVAKVLAGFI